MSMLYDAYERAIAAAAGHAHRAVLRELFGHYCDALHALEHVASHIYTIDPRYAHGVKSRADDIARYGSRHLLALAGLPVHEPTIMPRHEPTEVPWQEPTEQSNEPR